MRALSLPHPSPSPSLCVHSLNEHLDSRTRRLRNKRTERGKREERTGRSVQSGSHPRASCRGGGGEHLLQIWQPTARHQQAHPGRLAARPAAAPARAEHAAQPQRSTRSARATPSSVQRSQEHQALRGRLLRNHPGILTLARSARFRSLTLYSSATEDAGSSAMCKRTESPDAIARRSSPCSPAADHRVARVAMLLKFFILSFPDAKNGFLFFFVRQPPLSYRVRLLAEFRTDLSSQAQLKCVAPPPVRRSGRNLVRWTRRRIVRIFPPVLRARARCEPTGRVCPDPCCCPRRRLGTRRGEAPLVAPPRRCPVWPAK